MYKWITFKELKGMTREQFANELGKCCLGVWLDDSAGFGTFPLEAMQCDTPVIGKMPNMIPEWMEETDEAGNTRIKNNGVWTNTHLNIPELIATYLKVWLEDSVPQDLLDGIESSKNTYTAENQKAKIEEVYGSLIEGRIEELNNTIKILEEQK
jgi:glycosyltransferase involved in cell wall biosynthesis